MPDLAGVILDAFMDAVRLLPFLFLTYVAMEYMEHKMGGKTKGAVEKSGRFGPALGAVFGVFPQCGFSAAASNLYAGKVITLGTLMAVFLSTSDEMLPILISEQAGIAVILKLLGLKALTGMAVGFLVDVLFRKRSTVHLNGAHGRGEAGHADGHGCGREHCGGKGGICKPAIRHTVQVFLFIFLVSFILNEVIGVAGEDFLADLVLDRPVVGHLVAGLAGLIPNCAPSVVITQLYLEGLMGLGVMMTGLLVGSGVGLLVLFRVNGDMKENVKIMALLYAAGVTAGVLLDVVGCEI